MSGSCRPTSRWGTTCYGSSTKTLGTNPFYWLTSAIDQADNPLETMEATNGVATTPEPIAMMVADNGTSGYVLAVPERRRGLLLDHRAGQNLSVSCGSRSSGSGVIGLGVQLQTDAGAPVSAGSATETEIAGVTLTDLPVAAGTYLLRLSQTIQDSEVTGNWVRCGIHARPR